MKMTKRVSIGGAFIRKEPYDYDGKHYDADVVNGDTVKILNEGKEVASQHGEQTVFLITTRNGEKNAPFNQTSINVLVDEWGEDSEKWVGKEVYVLTKKGVFGGQKAIACYFATKDYMLDEYGELIKKNEVEPKTDTYPSYPEYEAPVPF